MCATLAIDQPLARMGRYVIYGKIASGGMATVHYGRLVGEAGFSRTVAIKRMHPHCSANPEFVAMLVDEAHLVERIRHPNVVPILDVVSLEDELLLIMEFVQGDSVSRLLRIARKHEQPVPIDVAAAIVHNVLSGLHAAHEATNEEGKPLGIVHRDVSPQNVMVAVDGAARVLDFGIAKASIRSQVTRDGQLKGKLQYVAPEQIRHEHVDRRTDVYSASVVLWEILAGRTLFDGDNEAATLSMVLEGRMDSLREIRPDVPLALDKIIRRGMALKIGDRYFSAQEMAIALEHEVSIATPRAVAAWLGTLASARLDSRAEELAMIERASSKSDLHALQDSSGLKQAIDEQQEPSTVSTFDSSVRGFQAESNRRKKVFGVFAAFVVLIASLIAYKVASDDNGHGVGTMPTATATSTAETQSWPAASDADAHVPPAASSRADAASSASDAVAPTTASTHRPPPHHNPPGHIAKPPAVPPTAPTASAKSGRDPSCNPPFTIDVEGYRVPKPHCVQ
jgi:eukaryotic-like serine/threonine-protein kinase